MEPMQLVPAGESAPWTMSVVGDVLSLTGPGAAPVSFDRHALHREIVFVPRGAGRAWLFVKSKRMPRRTFALDAAQRRAYVAWLGPPSVDEIETTLLARYRLLGMVALFVVAMTLLFPYSADADPLNAARDVFWLAMAVAYALAWLLAHFTTWRGVLALECAWCAAGAGYGAFEIAVGGSIWFNGFFIALLSFAVRTAWRVFRHLAPDRHLAAQKS